MSEFDSFLPIAKRIFAKTISNDLVSVQPMGSNSEEELNRIKKEVQSENRDRKIDFNPETHKNDIYVYKGDWDDEISKLLFPNQMIEK